MRSALARYLSCELSFVSLVLNQRAHFSAEHLFSVCGFLGLTESEAEYLLLIFHWNRAGTKKLETYYRSKLDAIVTRRREVQSCIKANQSIEIEKQVEYYSHWAYTAVHMALLNRELKTPEKIARHLDLPLSFTKTILEFFLNTGLAIEDKDGIHSGPIRMHIPAKSPLVSKHHANWRLKTLERLNQQSERDLHYSLVMSLSRKDGEKIRNILLEAIQNSEPVIKDSRDEAVFHLGIDLFEVSGPRT